MSEIFDIIREALSKPLTFSFPQMSTMAPRIDELYDFIYWSSVVLLLATVAAMLFFAWKYRESKAEGEVPYIGGNHAFEWFISIFMSIFFLTVFVWGFIGFTEIFYPPQDTYDINIQGQQWKWFSQYANGKLVEGELRVPRGVPIKLILTSRDVIHSFFVPEFRLKKDAVPGMYTTLWFEAPKTGVSDIFCAQYCGLDHSRMIGKVIVMEPSDFKAWLNGTDKLPKLSMAEMGATLFQKRNCVACHSTTGVDSKAGPSLKGLFGRTIELASGGTATADDNYIRQSITNPAAAVVKGYKAIMPTYKGLLNEDEIGSLVSYIKSLKE